MTQNRGLILVLEFYGTIKNEAVSENLGDLELDNEFLDTITKVQSMTENIISSTSLKLKTSTVWKAM